MTMKRKILFVEDDSDYRDSLILAITVHWGEAYTFLEASTVQKGLDTFLEHHDIQVIILDLKLSDDAGGDSGLDFLRRLKDHPTDRKYRVIISTGFQDILSAEEAAELNVFSYHDIFPVF